ncbi:MULTISPECIES: prepilin-type N-terminal cleavage/methylation domain-containing protein [Clostridium]|jgi:prepilin-type N-terminal cleavage/methylation domain-containing protein|uniref:pilus assembly FimT family protein n=1 Tax=Clostridium TaxID=1485 RepID=UPI000288C877|nr:MULTISPECIES: prepilin-type N-terminal cleavage/methylation domain-containing protein [Clostridium]MDF2504037.1 prepilin-type N-terminal cleavage/methylation protein [Clostridium sp.]
MQKLKSKKLGFTIIEVMCAISIFTLLFMTSIAIRINTINMKTYNNLTEKYTEYINNIRNEILSNTSNEDITSMINLKEVYIDKDNINNESIKNSKITEIYTTIPPIQKPYMKILFYDGDLIEVNLSMYVDVLQKEEVINCKFYRGK